MIGMATSTDPIRNTLTPETLGLIDAVHRTGSMAAAARELGLVPSALTYRIRLVEDALDVLLFDRSSRQAKLTQAGAELQREGKRLLAELDAVGASRCWCIANTAPIAPAAWWRFTGSRCKAGACKTPPGK